MAGNECKSALTGILETLRLGTLKEVTYYDMSKVIRDRRNYKEYCKIIQDETTSESGRRLLQSTERRKTERVKRILHVISKECCAKKRRRTIRESSSKIFAGH